MGKRRILLSSTRIFLLSLLLLHSFHLFFLCVFFSFSIFFHLSVLRLLKRLSHYCIWYFFFFIFCLIFILFSSCRFSTFHRACINIVWITGKVNEEWLHDDYYFYLSHKLHSDKHKYLEASEVCEVSMMEQYKEEKKHKIQIDTNKE